MLSHSEVPPDPYDLAHTCVTVMDERQDDKLPSIEWIVDLARAAVLRCAMACCAIELSWVLLCAHELILCIGMGFVDWSLIPTMSWTISDRHT